LPAIVGLLGGDLELVGVLVPDQDPAALDVLEADCDLGDLGEDRVEVGLGDDRLGDAEERACSRQAAWSGR
jgi:hypothetical protein